MRHIISKGPSLSLKPLTNKIGSLTWTPRFNPHQNHKNHAVHPKGTFSLSSSIPSLGPSTKPLNPRVLNVLIICPSSIKDGLVPTHFSYTFTSQVILMIWWWTIFLKTIKFLVSYWLSSSDKNSAITISFPLLRWPFAVLHKPRRPLHAPLSFHLHLGLLDHPYPKSLPHFDHPLSQERERNYPLIVIMGL